jgi:hypothetical protein
VVNVAADDKLEDLGPVGGDADQDGTPDRLQAGVATAPNAVDGQYVTLSHQSRCEGAVSTHASKPVPRVARGILRPTDFIAGRATPG